MLTVLLSVNGTSHHVLGAVLQDASDEAIADVAHFLPCLRPPTLSVIGIEIKEGLPTSSPAWVTLDEVLLELNTRIHVFYDTAEETWRCTDNVCVDFLPRSSAAQEHLPAWCEDEDCPIHG